MMHQTQPGSLSDEAAIAILYQRHANAVLAYIRSRVGTPEDAEDLLVEVFMGAIANPVALRLEESKQLTWLRRVARNKIIDRYRQLGRSPAQVPLEEVSATLLDQEEHAPDQVVLRNEKATFLQAHLALLPTAQQEVLRLRFALDLSTAEIARRLGKTDTAVRVLLSRTLNRLRERCEQERAETDDG